MDRSGANEGRLAGNLQEDRNDKLVIRNRMVFFSECIMHLSSRGPQKKMTATLLLPSLFRSIIKKDSAGNLRCII